jgi:hypothetical protein
MKQNSGFDINAAETVAFVMASRIIVGPPKEKKEKLMRNDTG